ncbi:sialate O-acetylesterase [Acinetobacter ursingii]|uniref:sialate O-acetylesterase n=1 Tax=Acinetobacter ursingii TaxID=108980 RepID=UPI00300B2CF3
MTDIIGNPNWSSVRLLESNELARGGINGNMNEQAKALVERTEYLIEQSATKNELAAIGGGKYGFTTLAEFNSVKSTIPIHSVVTISEAGEYQGDNIWDGSELKKSLYDPLNQSKDYTNLKFNESLNYSNTKINILSEIGINTFKMPSLPNDKDEFRLKNKNNKLVLKATEDGELEVYGVSFSSKINNNENQLTILAQQNQNYRLPLVPKSVDSSTIYINNFKFAELSNDGTVINNLKLNKSNLSVFQVPSLPSDSPKTLLSLYNKDGKSLILISEEKGKTQITGLDLSKDAESNHTENSNKNFNTPTFFVENGKTFKADEYGVSQFIDRPLNNPIGISNNACLTIQNTGFSTTAIQTVLAKNGKTFPNPYRVLVVIPFYGQSLSVGSGGIPIYTSLDKNPYPDFVLKFKDFSTIFDRTGGNGVIKVITEDQLKDFDALHATDMGNNYTGQTIADHMGIAIAEALNEATEGCVMRSLFFSAGVGGTTIDNLGPNSDGYKTLMNALKAAKRIAAEKGWSILIPAVCWQHGESGSSDTSYQAKLVNLRNTINTDIKSISNQSIDVHIYCANPAYQRNATGMASSMAMYRLNRDLPEQFTQVGGVYEGAVHDQATDWTHLNTQGYMQLSYRYAAAIVHDLQFGFGNYRAVSPKNITRNANIIDIEFNVPNPPLQFKTTSIIPLAQNYGFTYIDDSSSASISTVELLNATTVRITLSATPSGANKKIRAGFIFGSELTYSSRPRTNLCDSTPGKTPLGDDLNRFCLNFEELIN